MIYMSNFISASFLTTVNRQTCKQAFRRFLPPLYRQLLLGKYTSQLQQKIESYIHGELSEHRTCIATYNARTALYQGMKLLWIGEDDEVILQAYTCVSVSNAIIATGAKPIYVDIDPQTLNINPQLIEQHINEKTKAIIVQHTFGIPADVHVIQSIVKKHQIFFIEDCAHALGAQYDWKMLGSFGDIAVFSFGRDKVISSVNGGCLLINNKQYVLPAQKIHTHLELPSKKEIIKNLLYMIVWYLSYVTYDIYIGKLLYFVAAKLGFFPTIVTKQEKECVYTHLSYAMPNALSYIALSELKHVDVYNEKRKKYAELYHRALGDHVVYTKEQGSIYLRCVYLNDDIKKLQLQCKKKNIYLGDRYQQAIAPKDADARAAGYIPWSCPVAEKIASQTVNLPNHAGLREKDIERVLHTI